MDGVVFAAVELFARRTSTRIELINSLFHTALKASASGKQIGELVDASSRRAVESLRMQLSKDLKDGGNVAQRIAPAAGVWAREMLFMVRLSIRSFLTGYAEGKSEAEQRDWTGIQKKIFEDAGINTDLSNDAAAAKPADDNKPFVKAGRGTVVAEAKPVGVSATLDGIEFVRKRKKSSTVAAPGADDSGSDVKNNDNENNKSNNNNNNTTNT